MNKDKKCSIIQDLLPNYISNVVSKESRKLVEDHLIKCRECEKDYQYMNSNIDEIDNRKIKINYLRKIEKRFIVTFVICLIIISISLILSTFIGLPTDDIIFGSFLWVFIAISTVIKYIIPLIGLSVGLVLLFRYKKILYRVLGIILVALFGYLFFSFIIHIVNNILIYGF